MKEYFIHQNDICTDNEWPELPGGKSFAPDD
jgi:hypothetical protein